MRSVPISLHSKSTSSGVVLVPSVAGMGPSGTSGSTQSGISNPVSVSWLVSVSWPVSASNSPESELDDSDGSSPGEHPKTFSMTKKKKKMCRIIITPAARKLPQWIAHLFMVLGVYLDGTAAVWLPDNRHHKRDIQTKQDPNKQVGADAIWI